MKSTTSEVNVYYLPKVAPMEASKPPMTWTRVRHRLLRSWWRARLTLEDLRLGIGRWPGRHDSDDYASLLAGIVGEGRAELIDRRRVKSRGPATILDFASARLRLRPAID